MKNDIFQLILSQRVVNAVLKLDGSFLFSGIVPFNGNPEETRKLAITCSMVKIAANDNTNHS
jgi:hypothetical protein